MSDNSRAMAAALIGAALGGMAGFLFFTERGRTLRRDLDPALDDISRELRSFRSTVQKAAGVASEGWTLLNDSLNEEVRPRHSSPHQTSPF